MDPKSEWQQGVYDPGAFKLDHLQSTKPIFAKWISTFFFEFPFIPLSFVLSFSGQPTGSDIPEPVDYPEVQDAMIVYKCNLH